MWMLVPECQPCSHVSTPHIKWDDRFQLSPAFCIFSIYAPMCSLLKPNKLNMLLQLEWSSTRMETFFTFFWLENTFNSIALPWLVLSHFSCSSPLNIVRLHSFCISKWFTAHDGIIFVIFAKTLIVCCALDSYHPEKFELIYPQFSLPTEGIPTSFNGCVHHATWLWGSGAKCNISLNHYKNYLQQPHDSVNRCWRFLPISKTETSEKSSLSLLQQHVRRRSNQHQTLPGPTSNQVWNAVNTTCFCGQMLWAWWWQRRCRRERVHHWWLRISWRTDLVWICIPDNTKSHFQKTKCCGLCRDNGVAAFNGKLSHDEMLTMRTKF